MSNDDLRLLAVLKIAHETSMRGEGLSLHDALIRAGYKDLRPSFSPSDLLPLVKGDRAFVEQWTAYSQDKRTSGGWYLLEQGEIGRVGKPGSRMCFDSLEEAVAEYVVRELDYWAGIAATDWQLREAAQAAPPTNC